MDPSGIDVEFRLRSKYITKSTVPIQDGNKTGLYLALLGLRDLHRSGYTHYSISRDVVREDGIVYPSVLDLEYLSPRIIAGRTPNKGDDVWSFTLVILRVMNSSRMSSPSSRSCGAEAYVCQLNEEKKNTGCVDQELVTLGFNYSSVDDLLSHPWWNDVRTKYIPPDTVQPEVKIPTRDQASMEMIGMMYTDYPDYPAEMIWVFLDIWNDDRVKDKSGVWPVTKALFNGDILDGNAEEEVIQQRGGILRSSYWNKAGGLRELFWAWLSIKGDYCDGLDKNVSVKTFIDRLEGAYHIMLGYTYLINKLTESGQVNANDFLKPVSRYLQYSRQLDHDIQHKSVSSIDQEYTTLLAEHSIQPTNLSIPFFSGLDEITPNLDPNLLYNSVKDIDELISMMSILLTKDGDWYVYPMYGCRRLFRRYPDHPSKDVMLGDIFEQSRY